MNRIFRTLWSATRQCWQAVPENTKSAGKGSSKTVSGASSAGSVASVILGFMFTGSVGAQSPPSVKTLPTGGVVAQGAATISQTASAQAAALTVNQTSQRAVVNWSTFNLGAAASVNFAQPNAQAVTLNRVSDVNPSQIYGRISAPGQVFLSNPNGVYFSPTAQVDVGALTATTHSISDDDFMAGYYRFDRHGATGKVVNEGKLNAALGGYIALLAPEVQNAGVVVAQAGTVAMAAGELITLNLNGVGGLASLTTTPSTIASLVENKHAVLAPDGQIVLSAVALNKLQGGLVKNSGSLEANSLVNKGGKIVLEGDEITLDRNSKIQAKGPTGGGTVLVGGDWQGSGDVRQATKVAMEAGATIDVSATDQGNGGKVVLWSDVHKAESVTAGHGSIMAEGGPNGGEGGRIETSGYQLNVDDIYVSTRANQGNSGQWLLDPYNITISTANQSVGVTSSGGVYTTNTSNSVLKINTLQNALTSGNVEVSTAGAGLDAGNITITNTAISWSGAYTLKLSAAGAIAGNSNISIGTGGGLIFNQASTTATNNIYSGIISGDGTFTKEGAGIAVLTGANTYTGTTTISAGTLQFGSGGATATALMGTGTVVNNGTLAFNAATNQSFAPNTISGTGALTVSGTTAGSGTVTLRADNTYSGGITINSGPRVAAGGSSTGTVGSLTSGPFGTGTVTLARNSQVELAGYNIANTLKSSWSDASPTIYLSTGTSELSGQIDLTTSSSGITLSPALGSNFRLTGTLNTSTTDNNNQTYAIKLQLTGAGNVFEGFSSINAGYYIGLSATAGTWTLASDPGNTIGLGTKANLSLSGGTFDLAGNDLSKGIASERKQLTLNGGTLTNSANTPSKVWAVDANVTANSTLSTPNVGGDLDFTNINYLYGTSTVKTLTKTGLGDLHLKGTYVSSNVDFNINVLAGNLRYYASATSNSFSGAYSLAAGTKIFLNNAVTFPGTISGSGGVVIRADTTLSGANTYTGGTSILNNATLTQGRAVVMTGNAITNSAQGTGDITLGDATTSTAGSFNLGGYANLPHNIIVNGTASIFSGSATANQVISGTISDGTNTGNGLTFNLSTSGKTMEVSGNNTYTGTTTVSGNGSLVISHANALGASSSGTNIGTGTLKLKGDITVNEALNMTAGSTSTLGNLSGNNTLTSTLTHASGNTTISSDTGTLTLTPATGNAIEYGTSTSMTFTGAGNMVINGPIVGSTTMTKSGAGMLTLAGNNTFTGAINLNAGILRAASDTALGTAAGGVTVANGATLELGGPASPGGLTIGAEALTVSDGGSIHNVAGYNTYAGAMTLSGNATITVDTGTRLNFTATGAALAVAANKRLTLNLTDGNLTIAKALSGSSGSSYFKTGGGTLTTGGISGLTLVTGVYARLYDPTGNDYSSVYGDTPDYTFGFFDAASGGNKVNLALTTGYTGTATWTGTAPVASTAAGAYSLTYASGLTVTSASYALMPAGAATTWTVSPKPVTITLTRPGITYNGVTTYADLVSGTTFSKTAMVGTDSIAAITKTATLIGGGAANGVAQGGTYTVTPSNALMGIGNANNYSFTYTPVTGTVQKVPLTMTANDASILLGQADPAFTARYSGFVNGETSAVLTTPTVTRIGTDAAPNTYANVLQPSATSNNYNITPVNGAFTIVPADTLLVKVADVNKAYGVAPSYSVTSAQYLAAGNVVRTVNITSTGGGHFTYTDGLNPTPTTGSFDLVSSATANSDVSNYAISLTNFTKVGNNFTNATPSVQAGNLAIVPLTANLSPTLTVNKVYDGTTTATGAVSITNKVGTDDVSVSGAGEYTDNANVGATHAYSLTGLTVNGAKASNYLIDTGNLPALTGADGVITPAPLTLSTSNVVKTYDGSWSVAGATTAPVLTVTSGTLYANASNGGVTDSVSGGTFAFTNANAGVGNKAVTVSNATVTDGNGGGNYTVSYANNTTSTINPAALTLSTSNVVKTYDGSLLVAGATTPPALTVTSGTLYANASNGGATDAVTGGNFAFTDANAGTGNKTVAVSGATFSTGSANNYTISYANNTTSTINPAALTLSTSNVVKTYDGTLSVAGATTAPALTVTSGTLYANASNGGATDAVTGGSFAYTDANAGTGNKTVTVSGATFSSGNAGNYTVSYANNTTSTINTATPTLTGLSNQNKTVGAANFTLAANSNSVGAVTYTSSDPTVAAVNPATGEVTVVAAGNATITAAQAANGNYALGNATYTLTVSAAPPPAPPPAPPAPPPNPALTNAEILALTPAQVAALTSNQLGLLTNAQMALFNAAQLAAMTVSQLATLTQAQIAGLTVSQIQALSVSQLSALTPATIASLSINQIAALSATQIQSFSNLQLAAFTAGQIGTLSAANLAAFTAIQIGALSSSQLLGLSGSQMAALSAQQLSGLTPAQLGGLSNSQLSSLSLQQAASLTAAQLAGLTPAQLALLIQPAPTPPAPPTPPVPPPALVEMPSVIVPPVVTPPVVLPAVVSMPAPVLTVPVPVVVAETSNTNASVAPTVASAAASLDLTEMTTRQVALIPIQQVRQLSSAQIESMSGIQVRTLSPQQLGVMSSTQVAAFRPPQLQAMTTTQVASFAPEQLVDLQPQQIGSFSVTQLKAMTPVQAQTLSPMQLSSLNVEQRAAVALDTITIPAPVTTLATATQSTGVLPITVLDGGSASRATAAGVAFEQGRNSITLRSLDTPPAINTPREDMLAFNDKLTTFMVTSNVGELVEFQGSLIGNRLMIIAPTNSARQVARAEMKLVLAAAITTLGREQRVMLADLQGVVFDLR